MSVDGSVRHYDVAISFAGEDRGFAEAVAHALRGRGVSVFYDGYEKAALWGKPLYTHLSDLYCNQARYCILLLSRHYASKVWTRHEREAAQARAFDENREYILPVRLGETEIPGVLPTIGYLRWPPENAETIADAVVAKLADRPQEQLTSSASFTAAAPSATFATSTAATGRKRSAHYAPSISPVLTPAFVAQVREELSRRIEVSPTQIEITRCERQGLTHFKLFVKTSVN